jgi:DNA-binding transcriptional regulator PaaX
MVHRKSYHRRKPGPIEFDILEKVSMGDLFVGMLLSAKSTKRMHAIAYKRAARRQAEKNALERLKNKGWIIVDNDQRFHITKQGELALGRVVRQTKDGLSATRTWDGKWRLFAFDIPERLRVLRRELRLVLRRAGFIQLQQSLWVYPHECGELKQLLDMDARLARYVVYATVERMDNEKNLLASFGLRR